MLSHLSLSLSALPIEELRRLYRLFGHDSVTWEEAVKAVDVDKEMYLSSGRSVMHVPFADWACDYP